eukprot:1321156-Amphidinium_carterae.1
MIPPMLTSPAWGAWPDSLLTSPIVNILVSLQQTAPWPPVLTHISGVLLPETVVTLTTHGRYHRICHKWHGWYQPVQATRRKKGKHQRLLDDQRTVATRRLAKV